MPQLFTLPFTVKLSFSLLALIASAFIFHIGQDIIIPLLLSILFAILLQPVVYFLKDKIRIPVVIGAAVTVVFFVAVFIGVFIFISLQVGDIVTDIDKIQNNLNIHFANIQQFIRVNFNISSREQKVFINEATNDSIENGKEMIGVTITSFSKNIYYTIKVPN